MSAPSLNLKTVASTESRLMEVINLVPLDKWGFHKEVEHEITQHRRALAKKHSGKTLADRRKLSSNEKRKLVGALADNCTTVGDVLALMARQHGLGVKANVANGRAPAVTGPIRPKDTKHTKPVVGKKAKLDKSPAEANSAKIDTADKPKITSKKVKAALKRDLAEVSTPSRTETLKRLHEKVATFRQSRTKLSVEEYKEAMRSKRRISKLKLKEKKKNDKRTNVKSTQPGSAGKPSKAENGAKTDPKSAINVQPEEPEELKFSKFEFPKNKQSKAMLLDGSAPQKSEKPRNKSIKLQGHDYKTLINKVEARERKIAEYEEKDPEKAKRLKENIKWSDAMQRAEGHIVKNDVSKLRKSLKNKEKTKERSQRKWTDRDNHIRQERVDKQAKRTKNIKQRSDERKAKKMGKKTGVKAPKKGKPKPGSKKR